MSDVRRWLIKIGLENLADKFDDAQIDLGCLALLTERDLRELRIPMGPRRKLLVAIAEMPKARISPENRNPMERRQLTIFFCDMVGSTEYASRLDPEDFSQLTQAYLARCSALARAHGGFVANYIGDAFQVLFGYPVAEENDAERALQLAFDVIAAVPQIESPDGSKLHVRIGIASGLVVVGDIDGAPAGVSTVAFGPVPNLAQRLQTLAEQDTAFLDQNTFDATFRKFEFVDLGMRNAKGFAQAIRILRAVKPLVNNYRFSGESRLSRLVGRKSETERLAALWLSVESSRRGRVAAISGEPGIGKSRLLFEMRRRLPEKRAMIAQCSPAFSNSALYPFLRLLKHEADISDDEPQPLASSKLNSVLSLTDIPLSVAYPIFARLLNLEQAGYSPSELGSHEQEAAITDVFTNWFRHLASRDPLMLLIEDEQWIDPSSQKLLQTLVKQIPDIAMLLLVTSRNSLFGRKEETGKVDHLKLARLSVAQAGEMIEELREGSNLGYDVVKTLLSKAEGVPLFLEELVRSAVELTPAASEHVPTSGDIRIKVPVSLQSALLSRLDKLGGVKTVAQTAAVIGREFDLNTLAHVVGVSSEVLRPQIDQLVDVGLVAPQPFSNWPRYAFTHSLLQEAACDALLRDRRRELHARVAQAIELVDPRTVVEHPEVLAQHYDAATLFERAADYWLTAGRKLGATWAKIEAANMFAKGIESVRRMPSSPARDTRELELDIERGDVLYAAYGYMTADGSAAYRNVMHLSQTTGNTEAAIRALDGLFGTAFNSARFSDAEWSSKQLKEIGLRESSVKALVLGLQFGGMCAFARGRFVEARHSLEEALTHREHANNVGSDFPSMSMIYLSWTLLMLGAEDQAMGLFFDAERDTRGQSDYRLAACLGLGCILTCLRQDFDTLQRLSDELVPLATRNGFQLWLNLASFFSSWAKAVNRQDPSGLAQMQHIVDNMGEQEVDKTCYLGVLADSYLRMGRLDEATAAVDQGLVLSDRTGEHYYTAELLRLRGELLKAANKRGAAEKAISAAIDFAVAQGAQCWEVRGRHSLAMLS
ncbi:AAA family ATPase [Rhizobium tubonense]|uniref:Adenylate/guanylate cyclase domain-containing protein n=1 Tax=Rhizobium tubonense TaxID=484088 RepID=A0A2W4EFI2_9HYPH|nr:adenylate/guanylate cyclase domain-containing protein [Rhizobium tubonense]PZM09990.1 adenylate/guanylate cyclase domain-containing protein [Rhizobium tubonense]